jgi:hypothetical protein
LVEHNSSTLQRTVIVPTLDSPIPQGKSAIWCVSFQLAWNHLKDDVAKAPVQFTSPSAMADRLNAAIHSDDDVQLDGVYAAAGLVKDGILERIREQMASKFPSVQSPDFNASPDGALAYAYLVASVKFKLPYFENDKPLQFADSEGKRTAISSFGIRTDEADAYHRLRRQIDIYYLSRDSYKSAPRIAEFIIDPCMTSQPYQMVLALVDRKPTLAEIVTYVEQKIAEGPPPGGRWMIGLRDTLLVPNIAMRLSHRFQELEGKDKSFSNPALRGLYLDTALQTINLRLDRSGAELASEAKILAKSAMGFDYHLDRPFLLYMKKRDADRPFLVMWIDNAELLTKR